MPNTRHGKCLCGSVRFRLSAEPIATSEYTSTADSGNTMRRRFCPTCGSSLFANSSARPQFTVVRVGALDDPSSVKPTMNIWTSSAPTWACLDPTLEQVERQPVPPPTVSPA